MLQKERRIADYLPVILAVSALQFFLCEFLVAGSWRGAYSYTQNFISDLGVPYCGPHGNTPCSTSSVLLTVSFIVVGGSLLVAALWIRAAASTPPVASVFMGIAGIGAVIVGVVHSNANWPLHSLGASLLLIFGSCAALTVGLSGSLLRGNLVSLLTAPLGFLGLVGYFCYVNNWHLGLGPGGIERVSAYAVIAGFVAAVSLVSQSRRAPRRGVVSTCTQP
jgi:hypothetical membrane protein